MNRDITTYPKRGSGAAHPLEKYKARPCSAEALLHPKANGRPMSEEQRKEDYGVGH